MFGSVGNLCFLGNSVNCSRGNYCGPWNFLRIDFNDAFDDQGTFQNALVIREGCSETLACAQSSEKGCCHGSCRSQ